MKPRILVIDDDTAIRDSMKMILEYEGYECVLSPTGQEGLKTIERDTPDLVFLDIKMPGMDGMDVLGQIRKTNDTVPVVMISGHGSVSNAVEATKLGAFDFIEKPLATERVLVTVRNALDQRRLRDENRTYRKVVDAFFSIPGALKLPLRKNIDINCVVVDTSKKNIKDSGEGDVEIGFNKEVYFLCVPMIGKRFPKELFHIYPDRRTTARPLKEAQDIMNYGARKYGDKRKWPYRRLQFRDPETCQALQVVDIFIGGLAYRLNGHWDKPDANAAKKELSSYILSRAKIADPFKKTDYYRRRFAILHRDGSRKGAR